MLKRSIGQAVSFVLRVLCAVTPRALRFRIFGIPGGVITIEEQTAAQGERRGARAIPLVHDPDDIWTRLFADNVLYEIKNGYCHTNGTVLDRHGFVVSDLSVPAKEKNDDFRKPGPHSFMRAIPRANGSVAYVEWTGKYHRNYFHWLYDVLPRIIVLRENVAFDKLYVSRGDDFRAELLSAFGFAESDVISADDHVWLRADTIYGAKFPDSFRTLTPALVLQVRQAMLERFPPETPDAARPPRRLYLSRRDASSRRILNEDEIITLLSERGFDILDLGQCPVREQVRLFNQAECVVGPHGAALTNITFCRAGCRIIELFPASYRIDLYEKIAAAVDCDYAVIGGEESTSIFDYWAHRHGDFSVDIDRLRALLPP